MSIVKKLRYHRLVFVCIFFVSCIQPIDRGEEAQQPALVAVYADQGVWEESVQACTNMFQWIGHTVSLVDADCINGGDLKNFSILCIPGGDMYQYAQDISSAGKKHIRDFIAEGGGYIGICGGAYFASEQAVWHEHPLPMIPLRLFPGRAEGPLDEIVYPYGMCKVNMVPHAITTEADAWMLYYRGPALVLNTDADASIDILGRYDKGNQIMMVAFDYGLGRVFLIGTHPEIEEDSERDGVTFADELDDVGSDWELMKKAVLWCLKEI